MRTGMEVVADLPRLTLEELELQLRHVGADLVDAMSGLPLAEQAPYIDRPMVADIHWHTAEALRLCIEYRRQLVDRLAGSTTPAQGSSPQSLHDPPSHVTPGIQSTESPP